VRYEEPGRVSRADLAQALAAGDPERATATMVSLAFHDEDATWLTETFLGLLDNEVEEIRAIAATCLGHVARIHGSIDRARVVPALRRVAEQPVAGSYAENALEDIEIFAAGPRTDPG
jgi:hypothetical protein